MFERLWVRIPVPYTGWKFFTLMCCKNYIVCLKRRKKRKEAENNIRFDDKNSFRIAEVVIFRRIHSLPNNIISHPFEYCNEHGDGGSSREQKRHVTAITFQLLHFVPLCKPPLSRTQMFHIEQLSLSVGPVL